MTSHLKEAVKDHTLSALKQSANTLAWSVTVIVGGTLAHVVIPSMETVYIVSAGLVAMGILGILCSMMLIRSVVIVEELDRSYTKKYRVIPSTYDDDNMDIEDGC